MAGAVDATARATTRDAAGARVRRALDIAAAGIGAIDVGRARPRAALDEAVLAIRAGDVRRAASVAGDDAPAGGITGSPGTSARRALLRGSAADAHGKREQQECGPSHSRADSTA